MFDVTPEKTYSHYGNASQCAKSSTFRELTLYTLHIVKLGHTANRVSVKAGGIWRETGTSKHGIQTTQF